MPGGGSILSMVVSLRNNNKMLRRKNIFEKGRRMDDPEMTTYKSRHRPIEEKHLSESELNIIREKVREQNKKRLRKSIKVSVLVFSFVFLLVYIGSIKISETIVSRNQVTAEMLLEQKKAEASSRIQQGDFLVTQTMYGEAIFHYKKAVELFPESFKANARLANAYMKSCLEDYTYCDEGKRHLDRIIDLFPEDIKLLEIRATLFLAADQPEKANRDYEKINEIIAKD